VAQELTSRRLVDTLDTRQSEHPKLMSTTPREAARSSDNTEIVGIRLTPQLANAFKAEAARRGLRVNQLFLEMWSDYCAKLESAR